MRATRYLSGMRACLGGVVALSMAWCVLGCTALVEGTLATRDDAGMDTGMEPDGGSIDDGGPTSPCMGMANGIRCTADGIAEPFVCIDGVCQLSRCGDGARDDRMGSTHPSEACDDGNDTSGDGCESDCTFSCMVAGDCDDGETCNGSETCDATTHACQPGTNAMDLTPCAITGGTGTTCHGGVCRAGACPDGHVDAGEECDPSAVPVPNDGCEDDCTFTCSEDSDCQDATVCNGTETCDAATHLCRAATDPLACDDMDACTTDTCDMVGGCVFTSRLVDADMDGHFAPLMGCGGDDCDDADPARFPGNTEVCGGTIDTNCDGMIGTPPTWYRDCDGDGYAAAGASPTMACTEPAPTTGCVDWTQRAPTTLHTSQDCLDTSAGGSAHPGQTAFFTTNVSGLSPSYDYNCSGTATLDESVSSSSTTPPRGLSAACGAEGHSVCTGDTWYVASTSPACGSMATESYCRYTTFPISCTRATRTGQVVGCH